MPHNLLTRKSIVENLIVVAVSILFTDWFFVSKGLYNTAPILHIDYPRFIDFSYFLGQYLIPVFKSALGYSNQLYMGYPMIFFYPPGLFYCVWFVQLFGISYEVALKVILFIVMVLYGILPYYAFRSMKGSFIGGSLASLWLWAGSNSTWLSLVLYGMIPFLLSVMMSFVFLIVLLKLNFEEPPEHFFSFKSAFLILLLAGIAIVNFMSCFFVALILAEDLILSFLKVKQITPAIKAKLFYYIKIAIGGILVFGFWLFPTVLLQLPYLKFNTQAYVFSFADSLWGIKNYSIDNIVVIILLCLSIFLLLFEKRKNSWFTFIVLVMGSGAAIAYLLPFLQISVFLGINTLRYLCFFEVGGSLLFGIFIDFIISYFKRTWRNPSKPKNKWNEKIKMILYAVMIIGMFFDVFPFLPPVYSFTNAFYNTYNVNGAPTTVPFTGWQPEDQQLINWILANTDNQSRILMQCSGDASGDYLSGGHSLSYFAEITNRYYANGDLDHFWYLYSTNCTFLDDVLYGEALDDWNWSQLQPYFVLYNIQYVVVWDSAAKYFFTNETQLTPVILNDKYTIFIYPNATRSFIYDPTQSLIITNFSMAQNLITFSLQNYTAGETIVYSLHDYVDWNVDINGTSVPKVSNSYGLISFTIPKDANLNTLNISIVWTSNPIEIGSNWLSFITMCVVIVAPIYLKINSRSKKVPKNLD